jgi:hypothetical protein
LRALLDGVSAAGGASVFCTATGFVEQFGDQPFVTA